MAAFATMAAAEIRAYAKVKDGTWINSFSARGKTGTISVLVQRKMSPTNPGHGGWVEITDDTTV